MSESPLFIETGSGGGTRENPLLLHHRPFDVGREHAVYLSADENGPLPWVVKVPRQLRDLAFFAGEVWQDMSADAAQRDLTVLSGGLHEDERMSFLYTTFIRDAYVRVLSSVRSPERSPRRYPYALKQPFFKHYPKLTVHDLQTNPEALRAFAEIVDTRHRIFKRHALGVDIMGGNESYRNAAGYLYERLRARFGAGNSLPSFRFDFSIPNLLLPKKDITDGDLRVVERGKLVLSDVRLFRLQAVSALHCYRRVIRAALQFLHDLSSGAAVTLLREFGGDTEKDWLTPGNTSEQWGQRIARDLLADYNRQLQRPTAPF